MQRIPKLIRGPQSFTGTVLACNAIAQHSGFPWDNSDEFWLPEYCSMTVSRDAFKKFQEELAALDSKPDPKSSKKEPLSRLDHAKADFIVLKRRYGLNVADVVAFFPEEEGIAYLQQLITQGKEKKANRRKI